MLLINCEDTRDTNYTLQETVEFLHVMAGHMCFIAGLGNVRFSLVLYYIILYYIILYYIIVLFYYIIFSPPF